MTKKAEMKKEKGMRELDALTEEGKIHIPEIWMNKNPERGITEFIKVFPAGRNKKAVFKIVESEKEPPKQRNPNRLLLSTLPANPQSICFVAYAKEHKGYNKLLDDRKYALVIYPEARRLSRQEMYDVTGCVYAWLRFINGKDKIKNKKGWIYDPVLAERVNEFYDKITRKFGRRNK